MKNYYVSLRCALFICFSLFTIPSLFAQEEIVQVGAGEYFTSYRTNTGKLYAAKWGSSVPVIHDFGLQNVVDVDGAQYTNIALTASGHVYVVGVSGSVNAYASLVPTDNLGNPFTGNTKVYGLYQCYLTLRNGTVWYWGIGDVLNMNGGANSNVPKQLNQPPGKTIVKLVPASATMFGGLTFLWGLASDGTVWQWDRTHQTPFQVNFPGSIATDITMVGPMCFVVQTATDIYSWGFDPSYAGGRPTWQQSGIQSIKSAWTNAGAVFPFKEIVGNYNTLHIIDANDNMFASGSNPQGNIGNGVQYNPWRTAANPWQWDWSNGQLMTPPTQIPGKFKNLQTSNTITFYLYVQDMGNNWYSWGRNKAMSLGNGQTLSINNYAIYPEGLNVPAPTLVTPLTQVWSITPFNPQGQQPPIPHAGVNQYISTPTTTLYGSGTHQQEGHITSYAWSKVSGPNATIVSPNTMNTEVTGLSSGTYVFRLTVQNNFGVSKSANVTVVVGTGTPVNQPPVVNAGNDISVTLPTSATTLSGTASDPDGSIATRQWSKVSGPAGGNLVSPNNLNTVINGLVQGVYAYQLAVTDNQGAVSRDTVMVTVHPAPNQPPVVTLGSDFQITLPTTEAPLEGSVEDHDGVVVSTMWTMIGNMPGDIQNPTELITSVTSLEPGLYTFVLTAIDDEGGVGTDTLLILVNTLPNDPPIAFAGTNQVITLPDSVVTLNGDGMDPDGTVIAMQWRKVAGTGATIQNPSSAVTDVVGLQQDTYKFELTVTDDMGAMAKDTMQIIVNPAPNVAPTAHAGADQTIMLPQNSVVLQGTGDDTDGYITGYLWSKISGPAATISNAFSETATITNMVEGVYLFRFRVTDDGGLAGVDTVMITVLPAANQLPQANAGADQTITLPQNSVTLSGSGNDNDGFITGYEWTQVSGATATVVSPLTAQTNITGLTEGIFEFQLTVTDNRGGTATDIVTIIVQPAPNQPPVSNAGPDQTITLPQNSITLAGSGSDVDGNVASYRWTKIAGPFASIGNVVAANTTVSGMLEGIYKFELRVTDNEGAIDRDTMMVTVLPAPNQPPVVWAGDDQVITLPQNYTTLSGVVSDPDGVINSYTWRKLSGPAANIQNTLSLTTQVTGMVQGFYRFELRAMDNSGDETTDTMSVLVQTAPNQPPVANAGNDITITLPVNSVVLNGSGTDADGDALTYQWTKISGGSASIVNNTEATTTVNNLAEGSYVFRLQVTDEDGATATDEVNVTVLPEPNQPPVANAGNDITITLPTNSVVLNGSGTDADGDALTYQWTKISGGSASIVNNTEATTTVNNLAEGSYVFRLQVTDEDGATATDDVNVTVLPEPNQPPVANAGNDITITLPTNSVVLNGSGTDADGDALTYQWTKISGGTATIVNNTEATTTVNNLAQGSYTFRLQVTDEDGATATDEVNVTVLPEPNQPPVAHAGSDITITLPQNSITLSGSGSDVNGYIVSYHWVKVSGGAATIVNNNQASTAVNGLVEGTYVFQLQVTDNDGGTATDQVNVTVLPEPNVPPIVNAGLDQTIVLPQNSTVLSASAMDADGTIVSYNWEQLTGPAVSIYSTSIAHTSITGFVEGDFTFEITVTDNRGATATDQVTVHVLPAVNLVPIVDAGNDQTIVLPQTSTVLSGTATDPDGIVLTYNWIKITGPAGGYLSNAFNQVTDVTQLEPGDYTFQLVVTDNAGGIGRDTVAIEVLETGNNILPIANAGNDLTVLYPISSVELRGNGSDPDGYITAWHWKILSSPNRPAMRGEFEQNLFLSMLQLGTYEIELQVWDNMGGTDKDTMTLYVNPDQMTVDMPEDFIRTFPNPVANRLTVQIRTYDQGRTVLLVVYDLMGTPRAQKRITINQYVNTHQIDVSHLPTGIYTLKIISEGRPVVALPIIKR